MVDWQAIAVFVALGTWLATALFGQPLTWLKDRISWYLLKRSTRCEKICWKDLPMMVVARNPVARANSITWDISEGLQVSGEILATKTFLGVIETMFQKRPAETNRPWYLEENKSYIRTDGDTLLAFLLSSSSHGDGRDSDGSHSILIFSAGSVTGRFHRYHKRDEMYIVGRLLERTTISRWEINSAVGGIEKAVLRLIVDGYPPFYRDRVTTHFGNSFSHRMRDIGGVRRGGWIIAIGLSKDFPVRRYNGRFMGEYRKACNRVLTTLEKVILPCFIGSNPNFGYCEVAVRVVRRMNNESGSGLPNFTSGSPVFKDTALHNPGAGPLDTDQCRRAMELFDENREEPLNASQKEEIEDMLVPILRAAINGIYKWWQYINNEGRELPGWLADDGARHAPIWIEM